MDGLKVPGKDSSPDLRRGQQQTLSKQENAQVNAMSGDRFGVVVLV